MVKLISRVMALGMMALCLAFLAATSESQQPAPVQTEALPAPQQGVDILARGPVHEAFASPYQEPKQTPGIPKKPPLPIDEMPPAEKPEGDAVWIGGYWAWDDDRADFLWVSGCWRVKPVGKEWVPGYWREVGEVWQWVPGFWSNASQDRVEPVTYYPQPPAPPNVAPPGDPPVADTFYIPGYYMWNGAAYQWRAGYWTRIRPGYVYVPSHYAWTPSGYVFMPGYWDLTVSRRGLLYAPIVVNAAVVGPGYVYTPYYAMRDTMVLDTMFVRVSFGSYYFGNYYGPRYAAIGFEPAVVYSRRYYEPLIVYERWDRRGDPRWYNTQLTLVVERGAGRAPLPPRVIDVRNAAVAHSFVAPTRTVLAARGEKVVALNQAARVQIRENARAVQHSMAVERHRQETRAAGAPLSRPQTSALSVRPTTATGAHAPLVPAATRPSPAVTHPGPATPRVGPTTVPAKGPTPPHLLKEPKRAPPEKKKKQ